ncbi:adenylyl-sulfate kinase [Thermodesulforhabdus norvegica]|uniref:Adenylyl-sulfate kinase n=1 Tax=Thermodesulforhabdus norvegica TaxID=39841 RepID=A0A1I4TWT8_9BACT|nr:adenylyl-sulfate kinase [Thermodesulforhabdus norvegica]SFM81202.1 adenylylsulfate kinase [Thermodesulforhabdus norvegica]
METHRPDRCRHIVPYRGKIRREDRERLLGQKSFVLWFTGLSGSGKSTIAHRLEEELHARGKLTYVFDGDNIRSGLCSDLSFSPQARAENLRRVAEVIKLFLDAGVICFAAFISPFESERRKVREMINCDAFYEIYVKCPLEVCEARDVKGLYRLAREGKIKNYTGISSPYEEPTSPDLVVDTEKLTVEESINLLLSFLYQKKLL